MSNLSDRYFEEFIRKGKEVSFDLISGGIIKGKIKEVGKFSLVVEVEKRPFLLFKHSIEKIELP